LALAVFASSVAWAPIVVTQKDPDDPEPGLTSKWPPQYRRGKISARIVGDEVIINGADLPRDHSFFVKVRRSGHSSWERLGVSYSDRSGDLDDRYRLPQKLRKMYGVNICLKDVITNRAYCMTARR
jgi:hypothetical protein